MRPEPSLENALSTAGRSARSLGLGVQVTWPPLRRRSGIVGACVSVSVLLAACATSPDKIEPLAVPLDRYLMLSCSQLQVEGEAVARQIARLREAVESANRVTEGSTGIVAWWILWPELLYHRAAVAPKDRAEYARLLGERNAIARAAAKHGCGQPK